MPKSSQKWPEGLDKMDEIIRIMHETLEFSHIICIWQLGEMRPQTLTNRLEKFRKWLTPRNVATIFTFWVRERSRKFDESYRSIVEPYCTCLTSFGYDKESIISLWDTCSSDEFNIMADATPPRPHFINYLTRIRETIQDFYLHSKKEVKVDERRQKTNKETMKSKGIVVNANSRRPAQISTNLKENLPHTSIQTEQREAKAISSTIAGSASNPAAHSQTASIKPPLPLHPPLETAQPLTSTSAGHVSDLFLKPRDNHLLGFEESEIYDFESIDQFHYSEAAEDFKGEDMPPPKPGYECRNCNRSGHWTNQCPWRRGRQNVSKPHPDYECHSCGMRGDHFITSCPDKNSSYWTKERKARMPPPEEYFSEQRNSRPTSRGSNSRHADDHGAEAGPDKRKFRVVSQGHVRKRSDDVDPYGERSKRPRIDPEDISKLSLGVGNPNLVPLPQGPRGCTPSEGRLTPWASSESHAQDAESPDLIDLETEIAQSRGDRIAKLESESFLSELADEQVVQPPAESPSPEMMLPDPFVESNEGVGRGSEEDAAMLSCSEEGEVHSDDEFDIQVAAKEPSSFCSSPVTPRTPAPIEFRITAKSLYQQPMYHPAVFALFHRWTNVWVQKPSRPVALDYWYDAGDEVDVVSEVVKNDNTSLTDARGNLECSHTI